MSDLEKLFENAPEGATELREFFDGGYLRWFNKDRDVWCDNEWITIEYEYYKTIATRPQSERKTVEDVVASNPDGWNSLINPYPGSKPEGKQLVLYSLDSKEFHKGCEGFDARGYQEVCTREEFEACVAAKAESEPEWTHKVDVSECKVIHDNGEMSWVEYKTGENHVVRNVCLEAIKPTITEAEKEKCAAMAGYFNINPAEFDEYMSKHEVVEA